MNVIKKFVGRKRDEALENCRINNESLLNYRPSKLVTSTVFDNDDIFSAVANTLIYKHAVEELSIRDAINATIFTSTERESFLESLDLRNANMYLHQDEELENTTPVGELVRKVRTIFGSELQSMWRESAKEIASENNEEVGKREERSFPTPLKTPKNLTLTPVETSVTRSNILSSKSSGRQRRRSFFPDVSDTERCHARIRIDFRLKSLANAQPVKSLQLDGFSNPESFQQYVPPASPICTGSNKLVGLVPQ